MNKDSTAIGFKEVTMAPYCGQYAITITFNPKLVEHGTPTDQLMITLPKVYKAFKHIGYLYLQSELHRSGNVHLHGILDLHDRIKYNRTIGLIQKNIGNICLKTIGDMAKWITYCKKDHELMHEVVGDIYDDNHRFWPGWITEHSFKNWHVQQKKYKNLQLDFEDFINNERTIEDDPLEHGIIYDYYKPE